jgi:hypothetical protein
LDAVEHRVKRDLERSDVALDLGEVIVEGPPAAWPRWLAATGYLLRVEPDTTQEGVMEEGRLG